MSFRNVISDKGGKFRTGLGKSSPIVTTTTQPVIEVVRPQLFRTGLGKRDGGSAIASDPFSDYNILYLKGDGVNNGTTITDSSPIYQKNPTNTGVVTSTTESKYGGGSLYFAGNNNSQLSYTDQSDWDFDDGNYTIEFWSKGLSAANSGGTSYIAVVGNAPDVGASQAGWKRV